jgi:endonuclease-3
MARMDKTSSLQARARRIVRGLTELYPEARPALEYADPLQLLIATIMAAQCTDARVNQVTPALFARFPTAAALATANLKELYKLIGSISFYRTKARRIVLCCRQLLERHAGVVPPRMEDLVQLAGVGRKTANVVLGSAYAIPSIPVDTHVGRLSRRMGLTAETIPVKVENELMALLPQSDWTAFALRMMSHGRQVCKARQPRCGECTLAALCPKVGVEETPAPSDIALSTNRIRNTP